MRTYAYLESPCGRMLLAAHEGALTGAWFVGQKYFPGMNAWREDANDALLRRAAEQLGEYFDRERARFDLALAPNGTPFQRAIWNAISSVPFGETLTYAELARRAGFPGSARAAGAATGRNPIGVIVPCHRIVGSDGSLTGYAGGLETKRALLALEAALAHPEKDGGVSPPSSARPTQRSLAL